MIQMNNEDDDNNNDNDDDELKTNILCSICL